MPIRYKHPDSTMGHLPPPPGEGGTSTSTALSRTTRNVLDDSPRCETCGDAGWVAQWLRCPACTAVASPAGPPDPEQIEDPDRARARESSEGHRSEILSSSQLTTGAGVALNQGQGCTNIGGHCPCWARDPGLCCWCGVEDRALIPVQRYRIRPFLDVIDRCRHCPCEETPCCYCGCPAWF